MKFFRNRDSTPVKSIVASRAIFDEADERKRIDVRFRSPNGDELILELTVDQAGQLINHLTSAYEAIRPPLRRGQGAAGWGGME